MYAIVECGGKQYKVEEGSKITIERISKTNIGEKLILDKVLLFSNNQEIIIGNPFVENINVTTIVLSHRKDAKVIIFKKKPKKGYKKLQGHRQTIMELKVIKINVNK
jgi:large subunit ribosomal protein L21